MGVDKDGKWDGRFEIRDASAVPEKKETIKPAGDAGKEADTAREEE